MKRVLFDENLPRLLRRDLPDCLVRTVQEEGWGAFQNGELLRRAVGNFDVFLTADRRMQYQQKLPAFAIGVVVIVTPRLRLETLRRAIQSISDAVQRVGAGEVIHVLVRE